MAQSINPNGIVIYRGPSELDGKPIIVIATGLAKNSRNGKTGAAIQTWIMREDIKPTDAAHTGADASVCGDCRHKGKIVDGKNIDRSCYVTLFQAPLNVWNSYHRGIYAAPSASALPGLLAGFFIRVGSYGDPAAVPVHVWQSITGKASGWSGYSHQWKTAPLALADFCMASADTPAEAIQAQARGWRTFRVAAPGDAFKMKREVVCPASKEAGQKTNCAACKACGGISAKAKANITIQAHGSAAKINAASRNLSA